ncbi:MAG: permease [Bacillota bacterium]|nr:permease [Bacillota bacterium]
MSITTIIYGLALVGLMTTAFRDRDKAVRSLRIALKAGLNMLPSLLAVVALVGLILGTLGPEVIQKHLGTDSGWLATALAGVIGSITLLPSLVAFPLAASLLRAGAMTATVAMFITTLTMVGTLTAPLEARELGLRFAVVRNLLSLGAAVMIAGAMAVVLR